MEIEKHYTIPSLREVQGNNDSHVERLRTELSPLLDIPAHPTKHIR